MEKGKMCIMILPKIIYGIYSEVNKEVRKAVNRILKGAPLEEVLGSQDWMDTTEAEGLCIMQGPNPLLGGSPHYQIWLPWSQILNASLKEKISLKQEQEIFDVSLKYSWSVLGLLAQGNQFWLAPPHRHRPFLDGVIKFWVQYQAVGPRFTTGLNTGAELWAIPNTLKYVLANIGVPAEKLSLPLDKGDLKAFAKDCGIL
jgi:hypothetical protein